MKYDFTSLMNRSGHDAIAVDQIPIPGAEVKEGFSRIPMWVADMNFPSLPTIQEAMHARVNEPHFGYFDLPDAYFDNIIRWQKERNGVEDLPREAIGYENGVLGCVASAAAAFTSPGESILLHSPTYIGFTGVLENCGRNIVLSDLVQDENGVWRMDYADMDRKLKEHNIISRFSALRTTRQAVSGSARKLKRRWKFTKQMNVLSSPMRSGLT